MSKYLPTYKWWTATITAAGIVADMALTGDGINSDTEWRVIIALAVQRAVAYMTKNDNANS